MTGITPDDDQLNDDDRAIFKLTPKGAIVAALLDAVDYDHSVEVSEQVLETLFRIGRRISSDPDSNIGIAFVDGSWIWVEL